MPDGGDYQCFMVGAPALKSAAGQLGKHQLLALMTLNADPELIGQGALLGGVSAWVSACHDALIGQLTGIAGRRGLKRAQFRFGLL